MSPLFLIAGTLCIAGAMGIVLARQPVHQVLSTVLNFVGLAVLFITLHAEFMATIQIIVYGGAVMVLFLFVIALLSARKDPVERTELEGVRGTTVAGVVIGAVMLQLLLLTGLSGKSGGVIASVAGEFGSVGSFGMELLTVHVLPFELLAFVLMVAVIGVVILVGRQPS